MGVLQSSLMSPLPEASQGSFSPSQRLMSFSDHSPALYLYFSSGSSTWVHPPWRIQVWGYPTVHWHLPPGGLSILSASLTWLSCFHACPLVHFKWRGFPIEPHSNLFMMLAGAIAPSSVSVSMQVFSLLDNSYPCIISPVFFENCS